MTDFTDLWERTIQSQYGTSPHIQGIIKAFARRIDPTTDIETFYRDYFDPRTAKGVGLDIWGDIVGIGRLIDIDNEDFFGFQFSNLNPFNTYPFYYAEGATNVWELTDEAYRELIFLKAYANIADSTLPSLKYMLKKLFDDLATVISLGNMRVRVLFLSYDIPTVSFSILKQYGLLPLGAGVGWEYYQVDPETTFGFAGSGLQPFNQGVFRPLDIVDMT